MQRIFEHLNEREEQSLMEKAGISCFQADEVIIKEGDEHNAIYVILKGIVRVEKDSSGFPLELSRLNAGQIFGEMSFVSGVPASASIVADEEVEVYIIDNKLVKPILQSDPDLFGRFYQSLAAILSHRLHRTSDLFSAGEWEPVNWKAEEK